MFMCGNFNIPELLILIINFYIMEPTQSPREKTINYFLLLTNLLIATLELIKLAKEFCF